MLISSGAGLLVPVFTIASFWFVSDCFDYTLFHQRGYFATHRWTQFVAAVIAAAACYALGRFLDRRGSRVLVDKAIGEEIRSLSEHTFFFMPMRWWAFILVAGGAYLWIAG